uniref:Uncharacterized protein n=1 Tax=Amblyomma triste TaxID=251400 RepID=A0A023GAT5_AMBTT
MEESSRPKSRRRSSRSYSLLPSENDLIKDVPSDIPGEERLRILFRLCYKRALSMVRDEVDAPEELYRKLLIRGLSMFDEQEGRDVLTMLLKAAAGTTPSDSDNELPADIAARHHAKLKSLLAECKRWNELLEMDFGFGPTVQLTTDSGDADKLPVATRRRYDALAANAERAKLAAAAMAHVARHCPCPDSADSGETERNDTADSLFDV